MDLNENTLELVKEKIINQINSSFPEQQKEYAIKKIKEMNQEEFIEFLKNNKLLETENNNLEFQQENKKIPAQTPFRQIVKKEIPYSLVQETKEAIAVLEINPISKAHTIIIPKKAVSTPQEIPKKIISFANQISKKIKMKFKPKEVLVSPSQILGETIINLIPIYSNESLESPRNQASPEELNEILGVFQQKSSSKKEKKSSPEKIQEKKIWIPKRIP